MMEESKGPPTGHTLTQAINSAVDKSKSAFAISLKRGTYTRSLKQIQGYACTAGDITTMLQRPDQIDEFADHFTGGSNHLIPRSLINVNLGITTYNVTRTDFGDTAIRNLNFDGYGYNEKGKSFELATKGMKAVIVPSEKDEMDHNIHQALARAGEKWYADLEESRPMRYAPKEWKATTCKDKVDAFKESDTIERIIHDSLKDSLEQVSQLTYVRCAIRKWRLGWPKQGEDVGFGYLTYSVVGTDEKTGARFGPTTYTANDIPLKLRKGNTSYQTKGAAGKTEEDAEVSDTEMRESEINNGDSDELDKDVDKEASGGSSKAMSRNPILLPEAVPETLCPADQETYYGSQTHAPFGNFLTANSAKHHTERGP